MKKQPTKFLWSEILACKKQVNSALEYLESPKKKRRWTPTITIGPKTVATKDLILKVCSSNNYPSLPLLKDNKELREKTIKREKSPLFKVAKNAILEEFYKLKSELKEAIKQEKNKNPLPKILYRLEPCKEEPKEEKEIDTKDLSDYI